MRAWTIGLASLLAATAAQASTMSFGGFTYSTPAAQTTGNALQLTATTTKGLGHAEDEIDFQTLTMTPGTYVFSMDVAVDQAFNFLKLEGAPNNQNIDLPAWELWLNLPPGAGWEHVTGTLTVAANANSTAWNGHLQIKGGMYGNSGDAGGTGSLMLDNVVLKDPGNVTLYSFDFDTTAVGTRPNGIAFYGALNNVTQPMGTAAVVAVPEPVSAALLVLGAAGLVMRRRRTI